MTYLVELCVLIELKMDANHWPWNHFHFLFHSHFQEFGGLVIDLMQKGRMFGIPTIQWVVHKDRMVGILTIQWVEYQPAVGFLTSGWKSNLDGLISNHVLGYPTIDLSWP